MLHRLLIILILSVAPGLLQAAPLVLNTEEGAGFDLVEDSTAEVPSSPRSERKSRADSIFWSHVPADCHIDWRRHRKRPFLDFCMDLAHFFNTYDTTYVERNRYNFRAMAANTNFFQIYRIAGRDETTGTRQILSLVPGHAIKVGPRGGWRWLNLGYTFGVDPDGSKATELNFAAYNSRIGCDLNWQRSEGPFTLRRVRGVEGLPEYSVRGREVGGVSANTASFNVYGVLNYRRFSYPAAYNACTVQLKSAGSLIVGASYDYQHFEFDAEAAERVVQQTYHDVNPSALTAPRLIDALRLRTVSYHRIGVNVGYGYNWVPARGWLVSASISPSLGFKKQVGQNISKQMLVDNFRNFHVDAIFRAGITYNRQRWFVGASCVNYLYDYRHRHYDLNNNVTYLKVYVGVQFHKRRKFRQTTDGSVW